MTQIITSWHGGQRKAYCVECADSLPEVQAELEKAEDEDLLKISAMSKIRLKPACS